jgi:hypothetical protein
MYHCGIWALHSMSEWCKERGLSSSPSGMYISHITLLIHLEFTDLLYLISNSDTVTRIKIVTHVYTIHNVNTTPSHIVDSILSLKCQELLSERTHYCASVRPDTFCIVKESANICKLILYGRRYF